MAKDLYRLLGIKNTASDTEIKKAYRKLAIRYHPDKNRNNPQAEEHFKEISKAYGILSDRKQRSIYDRFLASGHLTTILNDVNKFRFHALNTPKAENEQPLYQPSNVHEIYVSLREIDRGAVRRIKILRTITTSDNEMFSEEKIFNILIKRGLSAGSKIVYRKEGNRIAGKPTSDVVFIVRDKPHTLFKRDGANIIFDVRIRLRQALCGTVLEVPTLQGERLLVTTHNEIISPGCIKRIAQRGLPLPKEPHKRGDLLIVFNIRFPEYLSSDCKTQLAKLLPGPK